jgi:hypothetical protein
VAGFRGGSVVVGIVCGVKERVDLDHALAHIGGPFQYLGPDVSEEGVRAPTPEDHDPVRVRVRQKEGHGCARADGFVANFMGVESKDGFSAKRAACEAELGAS